MTLERKLELITPHLLPKGYDFFEQQKEAIRAEGSVNIVAGPGSGKTTVLIAKYALLLKQKIDSNQGICLITHTNVAVDEIRIGLKKIGITNVEYPNFIGTIQEFFNTFFAKKAFHHVQREKNFRVVDDDEYKEKFAELFQRHKPERYTYSTPNISKGAPKIVINDDMSITIQSIANSFYKDAFEKCIKILFSWGIVNNYQCLELSQWYISKHKEQLRKAISNRFSYVLLDEAQDTSQLQYELLNVLFKHTNVYFQKFGDPYQALYNIFEGNNDAWVPSKETEVLYVEISETSRFGPSIANVVKNVCTEKYDTFKSLDLIDSFSPYYIIYDNEEDLLKQYRGLIKLCLKDSESFFLSSQKDAILSAYHEDLEKLFSTYIRPTIKPRKNENQIKKIYNFLLNLLSKEIDISFKELKEKFDSSNVYFNLECKVKMSLCIKELNNKDYQIDKVIFTTQEIIAALTEKKIENISTVNLEKQIKYFHQLLFTKNIYQKPEEVTEFHIGTIHSVKGETHRSTLLVLDTIFKDYSSNPPTEYWIFDLLKEYFVGNYTDPYNITEVIEKNETLKSLKLAYVALSRPTHLTAIAIPSHSIFRNDNYLERLNNHGWIRYEHGVADSDFTNESISL